MTIKIIPICEAIGAEIMGLNLSQPQSSTNFPRVYDALMKHAILLFRNQDITIPQQLEFAKQFGDLEVHLSSSDAHPDYPQVYVLSNIVKNKRLIGTPPSRQSGAWHSDYAHMEIPASVSCFSAKIVPETGGNTLFANMYAAYDALSKSIKSQINGLKWRTEPVKRMQLLYPDRELSMAELSQLPDYAHPLVRTHPVSGRKALFLGMSDPEKCEIVGLNAEEGNKLLRELRTFAIKEQFVYSHKWEKNDVMLWDNRATIHRATPWDYARQHRLAYRVVVKG